MKNMRLVITICFIAFVVGISAAGLLQKDREFSPNENRYLAEAPEFSWEDVLDGRFQEKLEEYLRDQSGVWHISILLLFTSLQYYNTKTAVRQTKKCEIIAIKAVFYERSRLDLLFL